MFPAEKKSPAFLIVMLTITAVPPVILGQAWILSVLWSWFVVPLGVIPIGTTHAAGITFLVHYLRGTTPSKTKDADSLQLVAYAIVLPLCYLVFGAVVHYFFMGV